MIFFPYENKSRWWNWKIQKGNRVTYGQVTHTGGPRHDGSVVVALVDRLQLLQLSLLLDPAISFNPRSVFTPPQTQDSVTPLLDICTRQWTLTSSAFVCHSTFRHLHMTVDYDIFGLCHSTFRHLHMTAHFDIFSLCHSTFRHLHMTVDYDVFSLCLSLHF